MTNTLFDLETLNPELNDNQGPYSYSTYPVFARCISAIPEFHIDTVLINVRTIVRNNFDKTKTRQELIQKIINELHTLIDDTISIFNDNKTFRPAIVLYYYDYRKAVNQEYVRPMDQMREYCHSMRDPILNILRREDKFKIQNGVGISLLLLKNVIPLYRALHNSLSNVKNNRRVLMISDMPLDYHLTETVPNLMIMESHTAKILRKTDLSKKIFKNYDGVPFNKSTHVLLGDKKLIKPALTIKDKRKLLALATDQKWMLRTRVFIKQSIVTSGISFPYELK